MEVSSLLSNVLAPLRGFSVRGDAVVAIDVGLNALRAIRVRNEGGERVLDAFRMVHGVGSSSGHELEEGLREVLGIRRGKEPVAVSVNSPEAAIRRIELPPMNSRELRESLPWEARRHIAGLADDAVLDAQVLMNGGSGPTAVVLVAFPRPLYDSLETALERFDVDPAFIDVSPLAAMNALLRHVPEHPGPLAMLELGASAGCFSIFSENEVVLFRDLGQRIVHMDQTLANQFALDPKDLYAFKLSGKLPRGETPSSAVVARALATISTELVEDLRSALLFLESRTSVALDRVHLSGVNAALLDRFGIADSISAQSGVTLERWNPLDGFRIGLVDEIALRSAGCELAAVSGLVARFFQGD
jgi:Tfp pilus assembly PilM family ATPase